ncbi:MAG: bifunctional DNA-formamidopyrimidine glycosylase/DNA-(apurinic or apyrimidinic site) lyase [Pseudomonadota bacterium]|nr:bifunctional DNA-formamidopyrimidine glycosylase/DNA-(apurinic or apyrimidinic site) lyase [Pseudomonadota bacterium]
MPELPEVETVRRALAPVLEQHHVTAAFVGRDDLRWSLPENLAARLIGRRFTRVDRRGKYVLMHLDQQDIFLLHLGMSGSIRIHNTPPHLGKHDHVMLTTAVSPTSAAKNYVVLNDPRRFGWVDLFPAANQDTHKLLRHMGPEPLGNAFSAAHLQAVFKGRLSPVKNALLNQQFIAGIGNIYASEALFHARISPRRKAATIKGQRAERLAAAVVKTLRAAIEDGGTSLRDHVQPGGEIGYFVRRLAVYGRGGQPCQACTTPIKMIVQSGRSSFYCPRCQG